MSVISYSQNFEDVMLWRALKHVELGFYIDVGANDPEVDSVTKLFYDNGWRGINIEPVTQWYKKLERERVRDINLNIAAGAAEGEISFYEIPDTGLSTSVKDISLEHESRHGFVGLERKVPVRRLTDICAELHVAPIHFLKVDVEGAEKSVLSGLDLSSIKPWIIVVESTLPLSQKENFLEWESIVLMAGYSFVYFDGLNRFYLSPEHEELRQSFNCPPNVFDDFSFSGGASNSFCAVQNGKIASAEAEVRALAQRVEQAETEAQAQAQRAENAETEAQAQAQRVEQAEAEVLAQAQRVEQAEAEVLAQAQRVEQAEAEAQAQAQRAENAETEAQAQAQRAENAETEAQAQAQRAENAETEVQAQAHRAEQTEAAAQETNAHAQWLQNEWDLAKSKMDELNRSSHHWWTVAQELESDRKTIYASRSWRITWPLRQLGLFARWGGALPGRLARKLKQWLKIMLRPILLMVMRAVLNRLRLKQRLNARLQRYPGLRERLLGIARNAGLMPDIESPDDDVMQTTPQDLPGDDVMQTTPQDLPGDDVMQTTPQDLPTPMQSHNPELSHVSANARRIYFRLSNAIERYNREGR